MAQIVALRRSETAGVDRATLFQLEASLGARRSREVLSDAAFVIVERLARFDSAVALGRDDEAMRMARSIAALSAEIGLADLSLAAHAARAALERGDKTAQAATAARVLRVSEVSLDALFEMTLPPEEPGDTL